MQYVWIVVIGMGVVFCTGCKRRLSKERRKASYRKERQGNEKL